MFQDTALERLYLEAEGRLGIRTDEGALLKFRDYLVKNYGAAYEDPSILNRVFSSGEAARFLTVNETYFFREPDHFLLLLRELLPAYKREGPRGTLRICSAASSSGCEAYSIAMVLEQYRVIEPLDYQIDAFDLNPDMTARAERGIYGKNALREDGSSLRYLLDRWGNYSNGELELDRSLGARIRFFTHNIMEPLSEGSYDIIFFRNALIYFSPRSRIRALSNLASALREGGLLIMGIAETAGVHHPLFEGLVTGDLFYFRKSSAGNGAALPGSLPAVLTPSGFPRSGGNKPARPGPGESRRPPLDIDPGAVEKLLAAGESGTILDILKALGGRGDLSGRGNELAAAVLFLLGRGDFTGAEPALEFIEKNGGGTAADFLRGEFFYFQGLFTEAAFHYRVSLGKNDAFWPAFYRLAFLASEQALRARRVGEAIESLKRGRELGYEVFIGGFSPDYYLGVLMKQNARRVF
ncbi:MAG: hypothetical protein LBQ44_09075 [Treponema sp.]|jgi:chemotaxis protein methyltransferase CheR|nr:hypothetical protein [Treponema sp.]